MKPKKKMKKLRKKVYDRQKLKGAGITDDDPALFR